MTTSTESETDPGWPRWKMRLHEVIFEADTPGGKLFDVVLLVLILLSVLVVLLESVQVVADRYARELRIAEWVFTALFTVEYVLRVLSVRRKSRYIMSFFGIVDLLAVLPTYFSLLIPGYQSLAVIRALRLVRVFRVLKLARFVSESQVLLTALKASRAKITVFLLAVVILVVNIGALMYLIEGGENGFTNIPESIYWAVVTMTTVGYGDIAPGTVLGKMFATVVMILGYGIIAVPTGIVGGELFQASMKKRHQPVSTQVCPSCSAEGHDADAKHCKFCGTHL